MDRKSMAVGIIEGGEIMWIYQKTLQHPVKVSGPDLRFAKTVITQYGGAYLIW